MEPNDELRSLIGEASFAATDTNDARRPKSLYAKTGTCSDGLDRRRRPYLLLNDANLVESMSCLLRTDGARRRGIARASPAEWACTLGVTRHLKREDWRRSYQRQEMMDSIRRDCP